MNLFKKVQGFFNRIILRFKKQSISVISASISADGSLIDIRYFLTRPDKVNKDENILLIEESTNLNLEVARATKNGMQNNRRNYNGMLLFNNKNNHVRHGSMVTLVFSGIKVEHIEIN